MIYTNEEMAFTFEFSRDDRNIPPNSGGINGEGNGRIVPGETKQAQLTVTPGKGTEGDFAGTLTVEATDSDGNPTSFSLPVQLAVEKPAKNETAVGSPEPAREEPPVLVYALGGGCGLLLLLLILQGILLRKKIHHLEEETL